MTAALAGRKWAVLQGDCLDVMREIPNASIDAVITDPPYGSGSAFRCGNKRDNLAPSIACHSLKGNDQPFDPIPWLCFPVIVLWGAQWYASRLPDSGGWLVWDKRDNLPSNDFGDVELAWTNTSNASRLFRHRWSGFIRDSERGIARVHPTQKPIALMAWVIRLCTKPGDTVLDPYMGSGTTGVACAQTGRNFIGIEIDPHYFEIAERRITEAQMQPVMTL